MTEPAGRSSGLGAGPLSSGAAPVVGARPGESVRSGGDPVRVTIGGTTFDRVVYDREGDVLSLRVGAPATAVDFDASPEGHALRYDAAGRLVGLTLVHVGWLLEHEGRITVTLPALQLRAGERELAAALGLSR